MALGEGRRAWPKCISVCWNGGHGVPQWWTHPSGTVDTVFRNGGHTLQERWTRCSGTVDTGFSLC
ncbi:hypothetical protein [Kibdelosporangium philippinense]|uniref:hypothetical protein n=1 Tax=Kibdelosporangium philippinense TaxID=211113 RepID=UPI0036081D85